MLYIQDLGLILIGIPFCKYSFFMESIPFDIVNRTSYSAFKSKLKLFFC